MNENKPYKRRIIVIKKSFQFNYATIMTLLFAVACFTVWWEIFQTIKRSVAEGIISDPVVLEVVSSLNRVIAIKVAVALILVWILSLALSHLVAGPLYRIEKGLEALRSGDLTNRIHLRNRDQLVNLATIFNQTMEALQEKVRGLEKLKNSDNIREELGKLFRT